jgi:hypothetical protein
MRDALPRERRVASQASATVPARAAGGDAAEISSSGGNHGRRVTAVGRIAADASARAAVADHSLLALLLPRRREA